MAEWQKLFRVETVSGAPVTIQGVTLTPQSQALSLRWPNGGFVWNRPLALLVEGDEGTERIPIVDVTLVAQVALVGLTLVFSIASLLLSMQRRRG
jgi:hypothetical protein